MRTSHHKNAGQNHDKMIASRSLKNAADLKYLGTTVADKDLITEEIKK
jgi:hypothetical protein